MQSQSTIRRVVASGAFVLMGMWMFTGVAAATPAKAGTADTSARPHDGQSAHVKECSPSHHSNTGHGANTDGPDNPYHNTCEQEHAPGNGKGDGNAKGKPCAGCVGNADDKNPPGQAPGGSDHNAGYECDRNQGVGKENPAHTGCHSATGGDTGGSQPPACPAGAAAMKNLETGELDRIVPGNNVKVSFTIAAGCAPRVLSLASYEADRDLFDTDTGTFGPGRHSLEVDTPDCSTEVDFVFGAAVDHLNAAAGSPYSEEHRLIDLGVGSKSCPGTTGSSNGNTGSTGGDGVGSANGGITGGSVTSTPTNDSALASAVSVAIGDGAANLDPPLALGQDVARGTSAGRAVTRGRPAEVLGVQIERTAAGTLARTGGSPLSLAMAGTALCLVGFGLTAGRRRRGIEQVSISDRLAGYGIAA